MLRILGTIVEWFIQYTLFGVILALLLMLVLLVLLGRKLHIQ